MYRKIGKMKIYSERNSQSIKMKNNEFYSKN